MKAGKFLDESAVLERGINALHKELGPVETGRFIALAGRKHIDSVTQHREWQASLDTEDFIKQILADYKK